MLSLDHQHEFLREYIKNIFGREEADIILANKGEGLFENTTIMNDEELIQMNLYKKFENTHQYTTDSKYLNQESTEKLLASTL